jgi:hypothetical protein
MGLLVKGGNVNKREGGDCERSMTPAVRRVAPSALVVSFHR